MRAAHETASRVVEVVSRAEVAQADMTRKGGRRFRNRKLMNRSIEFSDFKRQSIP